MENFFIFPFSSSKFEDIACGLFELGAAQFNQTQAMSSNFDDEKGKIKKVSMSVSRRLRKKTLHGGPRKKKVKRYEFLI